MALFTWSVIVRWCRPTFRVPHGWAACYMASVTDVAPTFNRRDLSDLIRDLRAENGDVWVFDPQGVAGEKPTQGVLLKADLWRASEAGVVARTEISNEA